MFPVGEAAHDNHAWHPVAFPAAPHRSTPPGGRSLARTTPHSRIIEQSLREWAEALRTYS
jgi:hypothetical protein